MKVRFTVEVECDAPTSITDLGQALVDALQSSDNFNSKGSHCHVKFDLGQQNPVSAWDFVEKYHPNYNCQMIADIDDLEKIVNGEDEEGDCARYVLENEYGNDRDSVHIQNALHYAYKRVYEDSIENFCTQQK